MPDRKIIIKIPDDSNLDASNERANQATGRNAKAGPHISQRENDFLPRRKTTTPYINFYDMGQVASGSAWLDNSTQILTTHVTAGALVPAVLDSAAFASRDASLFAVPFSKFRKITKGALSSKYVLDAAFGAYSDVLDNLTQWTEGGLKVEQADLNTGLLIGSDPSLDFFFDPVVLLDGQANRKITATNSYAASAVAFSPIPKMDVYLPPKFVRLFGRSQLVAGSFQDQQNYSSDFLTFSRNSFVINDTKDYQAGSASGNVPTSIINTVINATINNWKSILPGRDFHFSYPSTWSVGGTFNPGIGAGYAFLGPIGSDGRAADNNVNGSLLAVVKKGESFYYFWTDGY